MKIIAIIVLYKPNIDLMNKVLLSINTQVNNIILINNGCEKYDFSNFDNIESINLGDNFGIAYAQNRGIEKALKLGADYVLLSDQDTIYPNDYITSFLSFISKNMADVYCPVFYDNIKNTYSPIMVRKFKAIPKVKEPTYVEQSISSGSIINSEIFNFVGLMDERLFIDYVDFEWCWRAIAKGVKILTVPSIVINHNLGDGTKKILWKTVTLRSDARYFYSIRNAFYLSFHSPFLLIKEKIYLFIRNLRVVFAFLLLKHNLKSVKLINKAFTDALWGKL